MPSISGRIGAILARQPAGDAAQHQRDAGQLLAEAVVQIVADAVLLAVHGLQDRALQLLALAHVLQHHQAMIAAGDLEPREHARRRRSGVPSRGARRIPRCIEPPCSPAAAAASARAARTASRRASPSRGRSARRGDSRTSCRTPGFVISMTPRSLITATPSSIDSIMRACVAMARSARTCSVVSVATSVSATICCSRADRADADVEVTRLAVEPSISAE